MWSLPEEDLHLFLRRRRHKGRELEPPPLGLWLMETLRLASQLVPTEAGFLYMNDPTGEREESSLSIVACFGESAQPYLGTRVAQGQGFAGQVFRSEKTTAWSGRALRGQRDHDVLREMKTTSMVVTPLWLENTVGGVLELRNRRGRLGFGSRDLTLIDLLARYLSRAILNAVDLLKQNDLALHDDLTGLRNSRGMESYLTDCISRAGRRGDVTVIFVDVDHLKSINDELGHQAGSEAIRRTATAIEAMLYRHGAGRGFRFGGDEFVVILPDTGAEDAKRLAQNLRAQIYERTAGPLEHGAALPPITTSLGVATLQSSLIPQSTIPPTEDQPQRSRSARLLGAADRALYRAKENGRNRLAMASTHDDPALVSHPSGEWTALFGDR